MTLEANPPTVAVSDEQSREQDSPASNPYRFRRDPGRAARAAERVAERTAQELNLANNPDVVPQDVDASQRLRAATGIVAGGLKVTAPEDGQLIKFSYDSTSPQLAALIANGIADSFINTALQRRYEASAYARNFLERQINKTRGDLERSERALVAYAQQQGIINTGAPAPTASRRQRHRLAPGRVARSQLNKALADGDGASRGGRGRLSRSRWRPGPTSDVDDRARSRFASSCATAPGAIISRSATFMKPDHPEMLSLQSQIDELERQIAQRSAQMSSGRNNTLLADYRAALSAEHALQARVGQLKGDVLNLRGRSIQYTILQREVDTNRSLYDALLQRYKEIGVAGGVGMAPVSIVDRADAPSFPFKPNLLLNLILGLGLGPDRRHCRRGRPRIPQRYDQEPRGRSPASSALPCLGVGAARPRPRTRSSRI